MNYQESISRLEEASVFGIKPGLERMQKILAVLGNPEKACKMIHITGTNGKGSVAAMITSVLENTNLRVGRFTSPHLIDYTERIYLGGKDISREDFAKAATVVFKAHDELIAAGEEALTEFELLTAIAFWYFRENKADYAVMEVGMGGRFDATNVVMPVVSVITNVAMDHMQYLGNTLQEIAREKAGIIKAGVPVVIAPQESEALAVLQRAAAAKGVRARCVQEKDLQGAKALQPGLLGAYQRENAATAMCAAQVAWTRCRIEKEKMKTVIARGIHRAVWPGRMEILSTEPFLMVDGAHNSNGIHALCTSLEELYPEEKFHFVMGVMADKDYEKMIGELLPIAMDFVTVTPESARALQGETLAEDIRKQGVPAHAITKVAEIPELLTPKEKTIALGSLYFIGELKSVYQNRA